MTRTHTIGPRFELAGIVREYGDDYRLAHPVSSAQESVLRHIVQCRTAALGGHVESCDTCERETTSYNSCRDRHCPKCQSRTRDNWLAARLERLLPVPYFHVVFTIPHELNALALGNRRLFYDLLFATVSSTLKEIAIDSKHLGAEPGFTAVLHTWGQNLLFHPHIHCVVTGGGLSGNGERWIPARGRFFLPVKVLAAMFRGKFLGAISDARSAGRLRFGGSTEELSDDGAWRELIKPLYKKKWVVYAKVPFGGPQQVFRYLGRYTHRVAISNHRIEQVENGRVSFSLKDYADGGRRKTMTLSAVEFLRRFLLHVLPRGFTRIRHFGLSAPSNVHTRLVRARELLAEAGDTAEVISQAVTVEDAGREYPVCPHCGIGRIVRRLLLPAPQRLAVACGGHRFRPDTS